MQEKLKQIQANAEKAIAGAKDLAEIEQLRIDFLGKKCELSALMKEMGKLAPEERPAFGALANEVRTSIENALGAKKAEFEKVAMRAKMEQEKIDVTIPGNRRKNGKIHPLCKVLNQIKDIFVSMGFEIVEGPEIETDYYNFTALNIPENHPARDEQDTFYITDNLTLRSQTSPVQIRAMEQKSPPIRIIAPGRVYRKDTVDATHSPMFHQVEGLVIDRGISFANLKGCLEQFVHRLYGSEVKTRFRPHHFQFTEPSAEMDISCPICSKFGSSVGDAALGVPLKSHDAAVDSVGANRVRPPAKDNIHLNPESRTLNPNCPVCKGEGWIEILGAGMVHRDVLKRGNINPDEFSGFAFGLGLERVAMRALGVNDLRMFFENDIRFLEQF